MREIKFRAWDKGSKSKGGSYKGGFIIRLDCPIHGKDN